MRALAIAGLSVALAFAAPSLWRTAAGDDQRPAADSAEPSAQAVEPGATNGPEPAGSSAAPAPDPKPALEATASPPEVTLTPSGEPGKDAIVAPVKRSQPKTPAVVEEKTLGKDTAEPKGKSRNADAKPGKSTSTKKPAKKARLTRAETKTKKQ